MAPSNSTIVFISYCFVLVLVVAGKRSALETSEGKAEAISDYYQKVKLSSFLSSTTCIPSTKRDKKRGSLKVVHKHGPCSKFNKSIVKPLTMEEILSHDQSRVDSIRSRLTTMTTTTGKKDTKTSKAATIPTKSGTMFNSGNYIATVGIGTPKKDHQLILDTGSDLTWIQCQPCVGSCYRQEEPIFKPSLSTTYSNISCTSLECNELTSATGNMPACISSTCVYAIEYGDGSLSMGKFAKEKLTFTRNDILESFMFGCGETNNGNFGTASGILGLGRGKLSIVSQAAKRYGKVFSYCLPSMEKESGFLTIGRSQIPSNVKYTRLLTSQQSNPFYNVEFNGIIIGGKRVSMGSSSNMTMDSGTVITRLPPKAYADLSKAFRAQMTQYPLTKPLSILDTCYDLRNQTSVKIPKISMVLGGNTNVEIPPQGTLIAASPSQMCLSFAPNEGENDIIIYGNVQQMTMEIVYDMIAGRVGFIDGRCA